MHRTTIVLKDDLYELLRREAFEKRISISKLISTELEARRSRHRRPGKRQGENPLLRVAGILNDGTLTRDLDKELYDL